MSTPESPLDKKGTVEERVLTPEERITRLEYTLERAYNTLGKEVNRVEMNMGGTLNQLQSEVTQAVHVLNASNMQNIITIQELIKMLSKTGTLDEKILVANVTEQAKIAIAKQQEYLAKLQDEALEAAANGNKTATA